MLGETRSLIPVAVCHVCPVARVEAEGADKNLSYSLCREFQQQNPLGFTLGNVREIMATLTLAQISKLRDVVPA